MEGEYKIYEAGSDKDAAFAECFHSMLQDMGYSEQQLVSDWRATILQFVGLARKNDRFTWFTVEHDNVIIGSAGCQLHEPYPHVWSEEFRLNGLIWAVYVQPSHRNKGLAKKLTIKTCEYLKSIGCTRARLHAAPMGRPVYEKLGFKPTNEMELSLV